MTALDHHSLFLLGAAVCSVVGLILLIAWVKLNPVISLLVASLTLALVAGMPMKDVIHSFETGVGSILGHIAIIVALGTMLGKMMAESGAADTVADTIIAAFGEKNVPWAMALLGILIGLPAFFEVGFVLLVPVAFTVARRTGLSLVSVGLPMVAGLSVVHGLVPPHPAAIMAVTIFHADVGRTILYALLIGIPTVAIAGPLYARIIAPHIHLDPDGPLAVELSVHHERRSRPGFWVSVLTILLPVLLMLLGSAADSLSAQGSTLNQILHLAGNDDLALLVGAVVSFITLGVMRGFSRDTILRFSNECLAPTATITLLVGAGGGFGHVLHDSGVSDAMVKFALQGHIPIVLLAWLLAAVMRLATGSSTVAMTTAASIVAPIALQLPGMHPELLAISTGAGSLIFSHVNDGGFWLVKEYFNMSVGQTIKTWSVCETIISVTALCFTLGLWYAL
jgi:gluconate:H+ symporter, GntP family